MLFTSLNGGWKPFFSPVGVDEDNGEGAAGRVYVLPRQSHPFSSFRQVGLAIERVCLTFVTSARAHRLLDSTFPVDRVVLKVAKTGSST